MSFSHAEIISYRMSGQLNWQGRRDSTFVSDLHLTDDLAGGIVSLATSNPLGGDEWVILQSPMHTDNAIYFAGDDVNLTLFGNFADTPAVKDIRVGLLQWWPPEFNEGNYVEDARAEGVLYRTLPGAIVPEPSAVVLVLGGAIWIVVMKTKGYMKST